MSLIPRLARLATIIGAGAAASAVPAAGPDAMILPAAAVSTAATADPDDAHGRAGGLMAHPFLFSPVVVAGAQGRPAGRGAIDAHARAARLLGHGGGLPAAPAAGAGFPETGEAGTGDGPAGRPDALGQARAMILGQEPR